MNSSDLISVVPALSLVVVVIGWFVNNWLDRKHEISKRKSELRIEVLKSFLEASKKLNFRQSKFSADDMLDVQVNILTYGYNDEIDLFNNFFDNYCTKNDIEKARSQLSELNNLVRSRLRKELGLPKIV